MMIDKAAAINGMVKYFHETNIARGWWNDPETGRFLLDEKNIVPQKIALIHSEISEAFEGYRCDLMDDHLPSRKSIEVELADALIRIFDLSGALKLDLGGAVVAKDLYNSSREDHKIENRLAVNGKKF